MARYCARRLDYSFFFKNGEFVKDKVRSVEQAEEEVRTWYSILEGFDPSLTYEEKDRIMRKFFKEWFSKDWYKLASKRVSSPNLEILTHLSKLPETDYIDSRVKEYHKEFTSLVEWHLIELAQEEKGMVGVYSSKITPKEFEVIKSFQRIHQHCPSEYELVNSIMDLLFDKGIATIDEIKSHMRRGQKRFVEDFLIRLENEGLISKERISKKPI